ncbi:MAG TPA: BamA/TamA family outer membrane protein [Vicinamibacterales bacterium]|nr:BamA/TamA family outer membrane protein [Vicinamibacterales bacterium]
MPFFFARRSLAVLFFALAAATAGCVEGEQGAVRVNSVKFTGVKAVKEGQIKDVLATIQSSKLPWGARHYFTREQFEADLKRIVAFYRDRGFPDAKVASFDVKMSDKQDAVDVTVNIEEGEPIVVEALEYQGFEVLPPGELDELKGRLPLKTSAPLDRALAQASRETALDEVKDHGYPYATVRLTERPGTTERARVVTLATTPGTLARYGEIDVEGNTSVSDNVVVRQLTFRPNRRFRLSQLQESQRRLYSLETFQFANIEPVIREGEQPETVPVKVTVTEGKHRKVNFGLGYGSEEKGRASIDWRHVNFFGGARTLQLEGSYSALSKGGRVNFRQPYLFGPRYNMVATAQSWFRDEPAYTLNTRGGRVSFERTFARRGPLSQRQGQTSLSLTYTNEFQSYDVAEIALRDPTAHDLLISLGLDPLNGKARGRLSSVDLDVHRSTADSTVNARRGYTLDAHLERAGSLLRGDYDFAELILEGRYYLALGDLAVIAVKARGGSIGTPRGENLRVPFFRRYFLGGSSSLRGWGRFEVSPLYNGFPIGGHTMFESSAELRAPVWGNLSAVLFADAGNVWNNAWDFNVNQLRYDVGPGLRYMTPIGPIRADLGYQVNPVPGLLIDGKEQSRRFRFHFSIGQAF